MATEPIEGAEGEVATGDAAVLRQGEDQETVLEQQRVGLHAGPFHNR
jgi:hypothetical protein